MINIANKVHGSDSREACGVEIIDSCWRDAQQVPQCFRSTLWSKYGKQTKKRKKRASLLSVQAKLVHYDILALV